MLKHGVVILKTATHIAALIPLAVLIAEYFTGGLGANPVQSIQLQTGKTALNLLLLSLECTPIYIVSGFKPVLSLRQILGLYAFSYACLHLINYIGIDYGFNFSLIRKDALLEKRYIIAGLIALLLLLPLAITSTAGWMKRLGHSWKRLHTLVYFAVFSAVVHFIWQTKADIRLPLIYGGLLLILLVIRLPFIRNLFRRSAKTATP